MSSLGRSLSALLLGGASCSLGSCPSRRAADETVNHSAAEEQFITDLTFIDLGRAAQVNLVADISVTPDAAGFWYAMAVSSFSKDHIQTIPSWGEPENGFRRQISRAKDGRVFRSYEVVNAPSNLIAWIAGDMNQIRWLISTLENPNGFWICRARELHIDGEALSPPPVPQSVLAVDKHDFVSLNASGARRLAAQSVPGVTPAWGHVVQFSSDVRCLTKALPK